MAKGSKPKGNKNVFKVAGAKSLKAKNKAKAVSTQKKLTEVIKKKTVEVDRMLSELQEAVRQGQAEKTMVSTSTANGTDRQDKIEQYNKTEQSSAQALDGLNKMKV